MTTAILHLILAGLAVVGSIAIYFTWHRMDFQHNLVKYLFYFLAFFIGYHVFLSLPYFIFGKNLTVLAGGYEIAIFFYFLFLVPIIQLIFYLTNASSKTKAYVLSLFFFWAAAVLVLQIVDFRLPIVLSNGFIFWNANPVSAWLTSLAGFLVGANLFMIVGNQPRGLNFSERFKSFLLMSGIFTLTVDSLLYFPAHSLTMVFLAFVFTGLGTVLFMAVFFVPKYKIES